MVCLTNFFACFRWPGLFTLGYIVIVFGLVVAIISTLVLVVVSRRKRMRKESIPKVRGWLQNEDFAAPPNLFRPFFCSPFLCSPVACHSDPMRLLAVLGREASNPLESRALARP